MFDNKPQSIKQLKESLIALPQIGMLGKRAISIIDATLDKIIPADVIEYGFESFERVYMKEGKPILELSILLNKNLMLIDLTLDKEKQVTTSYFFTKSTIISLESFFSPEADDEEGLPYRAELQIGARGLSSSHIAYAAEGDRKVVNSLISYGNKCIFVIQKLNDQGTTNVYNS